ncbi:hypothetical protein pdam_00001078, partial [Pocillopora damicornis]
MEVGYLEAFTKIWEHVHMQWKDGAPRVTFLTDFIEDISSYSYISARDIIVCLFLGVAFTILRYFLTAAAFKVRYTKYLRSSNNLKPFVIFKISLALCLHGAFELPSDDIGAEIEQILNHVFALMGKKQYKNTDDHGNIQCSNLIILNCISVIEQRVNIKQHNNYFKSFEVKILLGWYKGMPVPQDIYMLYVVEAGFYFHSVYATLFMDLWRRDSVLMIAHHIVANLLILFSFAMRYHSIGLLVLFVHDPTDIILEFTKLCVAFKSRGGKYHLLPDVISVVGFLFYCRLYIFPIKVLYSCGCISLLFLPQVPLYFFFNAMIWLLFLMDIWWFHFIVLLIIRIAVGKSSGVEDTREIPKDSVKGEEHGGVANGKVLQNGELHNCASHIEATHTKAGQRKYNKEGIKKGEPNQNCDKQKDNEEPGFRR